MSGFLQGKTTKDNLPVKRFGYLLSLILIIGTVIAMMLKWIVTPYLFLITMYFLTGALWIPALIRPFYRLFGKNIVKQDPNEDKPTDTFFNPN